MALFTDLVNKYKGLLSSTISNAGNTLSSSIKTGIQNYAYRNPVQAGNFLKLEKPVNIYANVIGKPTIETGKAIGKLIPKLPGAIYRSTPPQLLSQSIRGLKQPSLQPRIIERQRSDAYKLAQGIGLATTPVLSQIVAGGVGVGMNALTNALEKKPLLENYAESFGKGVTELAPYGPISKVASSAISLAGKIPVKAIQRAVSTIQYLDKPLVRFGGMHAISIPKQVALRALGSGIVGFAEGAGAGAIRPLNEGETREGAIIQDGITFAIFSAALRTGGDTMTITKDKLKPLFEKLGVEYKLGIRWMKGDGWKFNNQGGYIDFSAPIGGKKKKEKIVVTPTTVTPTERGFVTSVKEAKNVTKKVKTQVSGLYSTKPNKRLMGEAEALLQEGARIDMKNTKDIDQKVAATMREAISQQKRNPQAAANLFNNLSETGTELGRGVQAFSMLEKMSPESIALSTAGKIKAYNRTALRKIPELTGEQVVMIGKRVQKIQSLPEGSRARNIAINELSEAIKQFIPSSLAEKITTVWKAGLLTSLRTHERNMLGNTIMYGGEVAKDPVASVADMLMSMRTGQRTVTTTLKGSASGAKKGAQAAYDVVRYGYDPEQVISKFDVQRVTWGNNPVERFLKKATDAVFRPLAAEDKIFWNSAYARSLYDQAGAQAINAGKRGNSAYIEKLVKKPTTEMLKTAFIDANTATFHDKNILSGVASSIKKAATSEKLGPVGKQIGKVVTEVLAPFTGVPSSIVGKTIAYSPMGLIKGAINAGIVVAKDVPALQRQAAQEIGRGVIGTGIFGLGAYLMSKGVMTGQPKDAEEADLRRLQNIPSNSIFVNGKWRNINSVGPQTLVLLAGAKFQEEMNKPEPSAGAYGAGLAKDQLQQTFLQGMMGPLNAVMDPNRYGKSYVGTTLASNVPNIVKDISKAVDPTMRELNTPIDYLKQSVPGVRNQMIPKRDVFGQPVAQEPTGFKTFFDLFNSKTPISNMVVDELARLKGEDLNAVPSELSKKQTIGGVKVELTPIQLDKLEKEVGPKVYSGLETLIQSSKYQAMDDDDKAKAINNLVSDIRKQAKKNFDITAEDINQGYQMTADSPRSLTEKLATYGKAIVTDPGLTLKAIIAGNPVRKVEGNIVVLQRQEGLSGIDKGDTGTQVDHIVPLSLGGTNEQSNLAVITTEENQIKAKVEANLRLLISQGKISKAEAQERAKNWRTEVANLPEKVQKQLVSDLTAQDVYSVTDETGKTKDYDIDSPITYPKLTGYSDVDKQLKTSYNSSISKRIKDIMAVLEDGQITADDAQKKIDAIKATKVSTGTAKKGKKPSFRVAKISTKKLKLAKVKAIKVRSIARSIKSYALKKTTAAKKTLAKYTVKAPTIKTKVVTKGATIS